MLCAMYFHMWMWGGSTGPTLKESIATPVGSNKLKVMSNLKIYERKSPISNFSTRGHDSGKRLICLENFLSAREAREQGVATSEETQEERGKNELSIYQLTR